MWSMQSLQISEVRKVNGLETNKQEQQKKQNFLLQTAQNRGQKYVNSEFKNRGLLFFQLAFLM